ncbi:hypothetical protein CBR_g61463 [Chara braunii]|uniref:Uncharacterized protein n=1 Tax=Chara braunii TaxID=69332 RepID=A0A388K8S0_CHABU|nr:hypothetical protein CBR_g61463 [Chara braunii]|eukprot:GBG66419.1 hypothetical protein CBR_g61463 [Chara braunii]
MASSSSADQGEGNRRTNDLCQMLQHCFLTGEENEAQASQYIRTHRDENEDMVVVDLELHAADMTVGYLKQHGVLVVFQGPGADTPFVKKEEWIRSLEAGWDLAIAHDLHGRIKPEGANVISYLAPNHVLRDWLINTLQKLDSVLVDGKQCKVQFRPWATPLEQAAIRQQAEDKFFWIRVLRVPFLAMPFLKAAVIKEFGQVLKDFPPERNKATPRLVNRRYDLHPQAKVRVAKVLKFRSPHGWHRVDVVTQETPWCQDCRWYGHESGANECTKRGRQEGLSYAAVAGRPPPGGRSDTPQPRPVHPQPVPAGPAAPQPCPVDPQPVPAGLAAPQPLPVDPQPVPAGPAPGGGPAPAEPAPTGPAPAGGPAPAAPALGVVEQPLPQPPVPAPQPAGLSPLPQPTATQHPQPQPFTPFPQPAAPLPQPVAALFLQPNAASTQLLGNDDGGYTEAPPPTEQLSGREESMTPKKLSQPVHKRKGLTGGPRLPGPYDRPVEDRRAKLASGKSAVVSWADMVDAALGPTTVEGGSQESQDVRNEEMERARMAQPARAQVFPGSLQEALAAGQPWVVVPLVFTAVDGQLQLLTAVPAEGPLMIPHFELYEHPSLEVVIREVGLRVVKSRGLLFKKTLITSRASALDNLNNELAQLMTSAQMDDLTLMNRIDSIRQRWTIQEFGSQEGGKAYPPDDKSRG